MQQQQGRTVSVATVDSLDCCPGGLDQFGLKPFEKSLPQRIGSCLSTRTAREPCSLGSGREGHRVFQEFTAVRSQPVPLAPQSIAAVHRVPLYLKTICCALLHIRLWSADPHQAVNGLATVASAAGPLGARFLQSAGSGGSGKGAELALRGKAPSEKSDVVGLRLTPQPGTWPCAWLIKGLRLLHENLNRQRGSLEPVGHLHGVHG